MGDDSIEHQVPVTMQRFAGDDSELSKAALAMALELGSVPNLWHWQLLVVRAGVTATETTRI